MTLQNIPLDTTTIAADKLNIAEKSRSNLFAWNGQFSPQLVHVLLETYAESGDIIVDPFAGSGTVLVEAGRQGLQAFGSEINPAAFFMAQTYHFINCPPQDRFFRLHDLARRLKVLFTEPNLLSDFPVAAVSVDPRVELISVWATETDTLCRQLLEALIIMSDFFKEKFDGKTVLSAWNRLSTTVEQLPYSQQPIALTLADARSVPMPSASVDLIITSPPYINVFNYHQQYRASAEAMGWDLLHVARSEIGSNRKHRGNRFLTVIQYCLDIAQTFVELRRICKQEARMIFVVGRESAVLKTPFYNGDIVSRIGIRCAGLTVERRQERAFVNRFGATIVEDIIHFRIGAESAAPAEPVVIAEEVIRDAYNKAPKASKPLVEEALAKLRDVQPSPLFSRSF